jgi:hypothetical protein
MFRGLFESQERKHVDAQEVNRLAEKYGDQLLDVLRQRIAQPGLKMKDRQHWRRILKNAKR